MQVTLEEASRLCFVVFSPAVSVCSCLFVFFRFYKCIFILRIFEYILKCVPLRTEAGGVFLWVLPHSWGGKEENLTSFSSSQHMVAFMGFICSTSQVRQREVHFVVTS